MSNELKIGDVVRCLKTAHYLSGVSHYEGDIYFIEQGNMNAITKNPERYEKAFPVDKLPIKLYDEFKYQLSHFPDSDTLVFGGSLLAQLKRGTWYCNYISEACQCDVWINGCTCGVFEREQRAKAASQQTTKGLIT